MTERVRLRVRTVPIEKSFPMGQDTCIEVVDDQGNAKIIDGVTSAVISVDSRQKFVTIKLEGAFEIDMTGLSGEECGKTTA